MKFDNLTILDCDRITRDYVCSNCWESLSYTINKEAKNKCYKIYCHKCGEDLSGFVTKEYVQRRKGQSLAEKMDAQRNIGHLLGIEREPFDMNKTIKELWPD